MSQPNAKKKITHENPQLFLLFFSCIFKKKVMNMNRNTEKKSQIKTHMPAQDVCRENSHGEAAAAQLTD